MARWPPAAPSPRRHTAGGARRPVSSAADHTAVAGIGTPPAPVLPSGGSTISLITSRVRVSRIVVPSPQVTATLLPSGLTATEDPNWTNSRVSPTVTWATTSPVAGSRNVAATVSVSRPGPFAPPAGARSGRRDEQAAGLDQLRPIGDPAPVAAPGSDSPKPPSALMSQVMTVSSRDMVSSRRAGSVDRHVDDVAVVAGQGLPPGPAAGLRVDVPEDDRGAVAGGDRPGPVRGDDQVPDQLLVDARAAGPVYRSRSSRVTTPSSHSCAAPDRQRPEVQRSAAGRDGLRRATSALRSRRSAVAAAAPEVSQSTAEPPSSAKSDGQGLGRRREGATDAGGPHRSVDDVDVRDAPARDAVRRGVVRDGHEQVHPAAVRAESHRRAGSADRRSLREDVGSTRPRRACAPTAALPVRPGGHAARRRSATGRTTVPTSSPVRRPSGPAPARCRRAGPARHQVVAGGEEQRPRRRRRGRHRTVAVERDHPLRPSVLGQRGEQAVLRLRRVREADRLGGEQQGRGRACPQSSRGRRAGSHRRSARRAARPAGHERPGTWRPARRRAPPPAPPPAAASGAGPPPRGAGPPPHGRHVAGPRSAPRPPPPRRRRGTPAPTA